jgi:hypothetical protein
MKRTTILTFALALAASAATAAERSARIEVADLTCPSCGAIAMDLIRGVDSAVVLDAKMTDETVGVFTVRFDDAITSAEAIALAVVDGAGYRALPLDE